MTRETIRPKKNGFLTFVVIRLTQRERERACNIYIYIYIKVHGGLSPHKILFFFINKLYVHIIFSLV